MINIKYKPPVKRTAKEELEYLNSICVLRRLNKYFNSKHGYDRGLKGISAEDFSMEVLKKILTGERSWEKSKKESFIHFCFDVMDSELSNYRSSPRCKKMISHDFSLEKERADTWDRNGLQDEFNGF
jgi:hypothetical protein